MKKTALLSALMASAVLTGCATQSTSSLTPFQAQDLNAKVKSGYLVQKTNTFFVINDSSSSMSSIYEAAPFSGETKFDVEKELLHRFNQTIPDVALASGLRSFGFGPCLDWSFTKLNQPVQNYSKSGFESTIATLTCSSGGSPMANALNASKNDLKNAEGNIALIIFSDGVESSTSPVPSAQTLKEQYGDRLCIYTVWVGNKADEAGKATLNDLSTVGQCGFSVNGQNIATEAGMANFVENVFFKGGHPIIREKDSDGDGVVDSKDQCPDTPKGAIVDKHGCWTFRGVLFDVDSAKIKSVYHDMITNAVRVLKLNPELTLEIQGHTDSTGSEAYNLKLSQRRAEAVKAELIRHGIAPERLTTVGYGESRPVAPNDTAEGRALNRRVTYKRTDR